MRLASPGHRGAPVPEDLGDDRFHDECGVFGVFGSPEAAHHLYLGLHALQHRGQEAAGIVTGDGAQLYTHRGLGLVQEVFRPATLAPLRGTRGIGHVRYSTAGGNHLKNAQPFAVDYAHGSLAIAHNGNLTNARELRAELERAGSLFQTTSDTEVLLHLVARAPTANVVEALTAALAKVRGAYSLVVLSHDQLIAVRDPHGFRPLSLGTLGSTRLVASEPVAFELLGGRFERDVAPGELVVLDADGTRSERPLGVEPARLCIFEHVYFARPDSVLGGVSVYEARKRLGRVLAEEAPVGADVVVPVPDSGVAAALGFAEAARLPFELGLIRSHYVGRTFIEPQQSIRNFGVRLKLHPVGAVLRGRRVVVIDDSIVRGTTSRKIVQMVREAGAREVHVRVSSPPTRWPCFYGIDTPSREELVAATHGIEEIRAFLGCDSLGYLSLPGLHAAVGGGGACDACFSGRYPVPVPDAEARRGDDGRLVGT